MAIIHSLEPLRSRSERAFNNILSQLSDEWHVFQNIPFVLHDQTGNVLKQGEIDVIVLHPNHGYLVIEVKAGSWHHDRGKWSHRQLNGSDWMTVSNCPREQSRNGFFWLMNQIHEVHGNRVRPRVAWALAFPDARRDDCQVPETFVPAKQIFFASFAHDPEARIIEALSTAQFDNHPSSDVQRHDLFNKIMPPVHVDASPEAELDHNALSVALASREVQNLGRMLRHQDRLQLIGPPGSGKTVLALSWLSNQDGSRLLLCFNAPLASWLRNLPEVHTANIEVRTFHDLGKILIESAFPDDWPERADQGFWDSKFLPLLEKSIDHLQNEGDFDGVDALAIDEGQDFSLEWLSLLPKLLAPSGKLGVFHDSLQRLRKVEAIDFEISLGLTPPVELETVHRVPKPILDWLNVTLGLNFVATGPRETPEPKIIGVNWKNPSHICLAGELKRLRDEGISPERILLISVHSQHKSTLRLDGLSVAWSSNWKPGLIRMDSAMRLKGVEADIVIITDWNASDIHDEQMRKRLLVAATRSRHSLILLRED